MAATDVSGPHVRPAEETDAVAVQAIYAPIVEHSTISFETEAPDVEEMARRIRSARASHAWLVAEHGGELAGYAYGSAHRARAAYRFSTEVSVYVHERHRGTGVGGLLYQHLFIVLARRGYFHAYAGITQPNAASMRLHERAGFTHIGTFPQVGYKFDAWHDVAWCYRPLRDGRPTEEPA